MDSKINKIILFTFIIFKVSFINSFAQSESNNLQKLVRLDIGLLGTWASYEHPIAAKWTLMTEVGANPVIFGGSLASKGFGVSGRVSFGTRYYYDRNIRIAKNMKIINNSGNFLQLIADYQPSGFGYISVSDRSIIRELRFIPVWGGRRNIGSSRWSFESRIGIGYSYIIEDVETERTHNIAYDIRLVIGYTIFKK